jgi:hypothetical protein
MRNAECKMENAEWSDTPHSAFRTRHSLLAWAGWQLKMPAAWQPLKLTGSPDKGQMIVGNEEYATFIVKWEKAGKRKAFDGQQWVNQRLTRHGVVSDPDPPGRRHFTACGWARDLQTEEDKETTYWYGYARESGLLMGITVNGVLPASIRSKVVDQVLPSLHTSSPHESSIWAMYDLSFTVPSGFLLQQRHLYSGDVALLFIRGRRESLFVRQVYPGELALDRRSWEGWLDSSPFKAHRRMRKRTMQLKPWQHPDRKELTGMQRQGWKRVPFPLGWCSPRQTRSIGVQDRKLNRLLMAEYMSVSLSDERIVRRAVEQMNQVAGGNTC